LIFQKKNNQVILVKIIFLNEFTIYFYNTVITILDFEKEFIVIKVIATGEFGKVYKCKSKSNDLIYAVKNSHIVDG